MAIGTYAELKTAVANWLHRADLSSRVPEFVALAESNIRQDVRCRAMEQSATGTLSGATLALPTRFAEARRVIIGARTQRYVTPEEWYALRNSVNGRYTIIGDDFHFQSSDADYQIDYYQWFAPLSGDSDTNWLLTNHPDVYLFSSLAEAALFTRDDPSMWIQRYGAAVAKLKAAEANFGGPLVVRPEVTEW